VGLTLKNLISSGENALAWAGVENARLDAETLLCFAAGFERQDIFMDPGRGIDDACRENYFNLINRRAAGEPLQYITGEQYFFGHRFLVDARVLIPRPETECLVERAVGYLQAREGAKRVLDLCTGSGAIAVSISKACPYLEISASDISEQALAVAEENAQRLGVTGNIKFIKSDLFNGLGCDPLHDGPREKYDLIVTNPPYIRTDELHSLQREIRGHEPLSALDGGADGLAFYRRIAAEARAWLCAGGCLMAEIGYDQARDASVIFKTAGFQTVEIFQDLAGYDRILTAL